MIITISGKQGAGKTTLAEKLAEQLNYKIISIGNLRGEIAKEKGMTIDELNELGKKEDWVHKEADKKTIEVGEKEDDFIIEGWIAYHFIPNSKKVFLEIDENVGAKRIFENQRLDEKPCKNLKEMKNQLKERLKITNNQFKKYYGINFLDKSNYDMIIDTTNLSIKNAVDIIQKKLRIK